MQATEHNDNKTDGVVRVYLTDKEGNYLGDIEVPPDSDLNSDQIGTPGLSVFVFSDDEIDSPAYKERERIYKTLLENQNAAHMHAMTANSWVCMTCNTSLNDCALVKKHKG